MGLSGPGAPIAWAGRPIPTPSPVRGTPEAFRLRLLPRAREVFEQPEAERFSALAIPGLPPDPATSCSLRSGEVLQMKVTRRVFDAHTHIGEMAPYRYYGLPEPVNPTLFE